MTAGPPLPGVAADYAEPARLLAELARRIAASLDLQQTLQMVAQSIVDHLGFGCAAVNMVRPGDICEAVAVAGPQEAAQALLGTHASVDTWNKLLASCEPWGGLRFLDHRSDQRHARSVAGWVPPAGPCDAADAWHPNNVLLAPLHAPDGTLTGVLSVDLPAGGRYPNARSRQLLEQFAVHAALAIEHARVHTLVADSEQLFRAVFDQSPIAIALLTEDHCITRVNAAFERLLGRPAAALIGSTAPELARPEPAQARRRTDAAADPREQYEIHFTRPDRSEVRGRVSSAALAAEAGRGPGLVLTQIEDITVLRAMQARFAHGATHDHLTGLANRALVMDRLTAALGDPGRGGDQVAAFFCDLDHFKLVNDTMGHAAGDQLLAEVARRLRLAARESDTVGRLGGDEFVVIGYPVPSAAEAAGIAARIIYAVEQPLTLCGKPVSPSVSVGAALSASGRTADQLLACADSALYMAKAAGGSQWRLAAGS